MAASVAPGSFAAVLKQSKFATFHPSIAQAYVAHGGSAHRGDWGLKRPLPVRDRKKHLFISAIDTREQQTWFDSAEAGVRNLRRWEEISCDVEPIKGRVRRGDGEKLVEIDSEFANYGIPAIRAADSDLPMFPPDLRIRHSSRPAYPNIHKMSNKMFERYLEDVRALRPQFKEQIDIMSKARADTAAEMAEADDRTFAHDPQDYASLYYLANARDTTNAAYANKFFKDLARQQAADANTRHLVPVPHENGGLTYNRTSHLQTRFRKPTVPGRVVDYGSNVFGRPNKHTSMVAIGGQMTSMSQVYRETDQIVDYTRLDRNRGKVVARVMEARLVTKPKVVSRVPSWQAASNFAVNAQTVSVTDQNKVKNPSLPGSPSYCGHETATIAPTTLRRNSFQQRARSSRSEDSTIQNILGNLENHGAGRNTMSYFAQDSQAHR